MNSYPHYHVYGTDFDRADGVRLMIWPATDAAFRYASGDDVEQRAVRTVPWPLPSKLPPVFDDQLSAAILVLPESPATSVWERTWALIERIRRTSPRAGIHVVQDESDWRRIRTTRAAAGRLSTLTQGASARRPRVGDWADGLGKAIGEAIGREIGEGLAFGMASLWIVPDPADRHRYRIASCDTRTEQADRTRTVELAELLELAHTAQPTWMSAMLSVDGA